jgi:hypothetical protein
MEISSTVKIKYNEKKIIDAIYEYIISTYNKHYVGKNAIQVNDLIESLGHAESSYVANAIEYLARYGRKDGQRNYLDLFKAVHNIIFLLNLNHKKDLELDNK